MKFKIKKQLLNEEVVEEASKRAKRRSRSKKSEPSPSPTPTSSGGPPLPKEIKSAVQRILAYRQKPEIFDAPPIKDAGDVQGFLAIASDDQKAAIGNDLIDRMQRAITAVANAKTTAAADAERAKTAAADKEKEAQQAPMKKAIRTLVIFALNKDSNAINVGESPENKFKFSIDEFKKYLKQIKDALEYVKNHELSSITEIISEDAPSVIDNLTNLAFTDATLLANTIKAIEKRIARVEDEASSAEKNKEFENSPKKKALTILALFALNGAGKDFGSEGDFKYDNKILEKNLDKVKKALSMVEGGDSDLDLTEAKLHERKIIKESVEKAKELATDDNLNKIVELIKARIQKIESDKASADEDEATKKQQEEQRKKEVSELITVCSFFHDKVGFDKYYSRKIIRYALSKATFGLVDSEETKIRKKFPNIDMYLKWIDKNLQNFSEEKIIENYEDGDPQVFEEMKKIRGRILTKYTPTFKAISAMFGGYNYSDNTIQSRIGKEEGPEGSFLYVKEIQPLQESKKYKLKLIENKRG